MFNVSPESRIARDLGVPVEKLIEHATEEAKKGQLLCPTCGEAIYSLPVGETRVGKNPCRICSPDGTIVSRPATPAEVQEVAESMAQPQYEPRPCLDPTKMKGYEDQFPGSDYD